MAIFGKVRPPLSRAVRLAPDITTAPPPQSPSPSLETVPMWNILPLYQLYESTFSKTVMPAADDYDRAPPTYEATLPPAAASSDYFLPQFSPQARWENSILAHVHRMKHLADVAPGAAARLQVQVELTTEPGVEGVVPQVYDGESREFRQGDRIHGFVTVRNVLAAPLPFSMCLVVFEGKISVVGWDDKPPRVYKFLNMFDYTASWTPAHFAEAPPGVVDAADGTRLAFPEVPLFAPGVAYKKFFSFTVPSRLLDCCCETHNFPEHCRVPPLVGVDKDMFLQRLRRARTAHRRPPLRIRDYGFSDTALSYCVEARVVGRLADYGGADEFVIVSHSSAPVRVVPHTAPGTPDAAAYRALVSEVKRGLAAGRRLATSTPSNLNSSDSNSLGLDGGDDGVARRSSTVKRGQLYSPLPLFPVPAAVYSTTLPYKKRSLAQPAKVVGMVTASTPTATHVVPYVSPLTPVTLPGLVITVPVLLTYAATDAKGAPPEIRGVSAEIVACTLRLRKYPIPIELVPEVCVSPAGGFDKVVVEPFAAYLAEYTRLSAVVPATRMLAADTAMDLKCLATLGVKTNSVKVPAVRAVGGLGGWRKQGATTHSAHMDVAVDLASLFRHDALELECLVPSFQSCILCRYYYLVVTVRLHTGEAIAVKVSVSIEN